MPSDIPAEVAYIAGVWCEAVLYGIHLVVFGFICNIFLTEAPVMGRGTPSTILLAFSFCMFVLSTAHVALGVQSLLQGFIYANGETAAVYFRENVFPKRKAIYIINTLLGDSLLIWRVIMIWQKKWKIYSFPLVLLLGTAVCGIKTIVANALSAGSSVFDPSILSWITSTFVLNIATQLTATALITIRIYSALNLADSKFKTRAHYMSLVWLIVESGAIYTSAALVQLITYLLKMNAGVILEFILAQVCAIAPDLILIRVALGLGSESKGCLSDDVLLTTFRSTYDTSHTATANPVDGEKSFLDRYESHVPVEQSLHPPPRSRRRSSVAEHEVSHGL